MVTKHNMLWISVTVIVMVLQNTNCQWHQTLGWGAAGMVGKRTNPSSIFSQDSQDDSLCDDRRNSEVMKLIRDLLQAEIMRTDYCYNRKFEENRVRGFTKQDAPRV
ncbi:uncharacterized protein LOC106179818 [Lingula anatina]|uniref:Uncharacterized protein LOC106179818 n=1 Tax=Lingula anatina TaxID=7574 RepID=A0A1S3K9B2_LINAN|nr:uncharacterized protein LOC106179818 [Lingula anatina]|eukprot:XP_013419039.1 uncharacterized protein LOC106179818 [Lingula anatina]